MFESRYVMCPTKYAMESKSLQDDYHEAWSDLPKLFNPKKRQAA
jgi:homogentisate 1,2-dioxygenase